MPVKENEKATPVDIIVGDDVWPTRRYSASWRKVSRGTGQIRILRESARARIRQSSDVYLATNTTSISSTIDSTQLKSISSIRKRFLLLVDEQTDRLAEVLPRLHVRSEKRLHIVSREREKEFSDILTRLVAMMTRRSDSESILDAYWADDLLVVISPMFNRLHVPLSKIPRVCDASVADRRRFEIDEYGDYIYWPSQDVHMGWSQFQQAIDPQARLRAEQKNEKFNKAYGAAIREVRESKGLRQSDIEGLDDRTVRRIEIGETRATRAAIVAMAKAHRLTPEEYMEQVAETMK